jgi:hypothetical protein
MAPDVNAPEGTWKAGLLETVIRYVRKLQPCFVWYGKPLQTISFRLFLSLSDIFALADTVNSIDLYEWTKNLQTADDGGN